MIILDNGKGTKLNISMKSYKYGTLTDDVSAAYIESLGLRPSEDDGHYYYHDIMRVVSLMELWHAAKDDRRLYIESHHYDA